MFAELGTGFSSTIAWTVWILCFGCAEDIVARDSLESSLPVPAPETGGKNDPGRWGSSTDSVKGEARGVGGNGRLFEVGAGTGGGVVEW